MSDRKEQQDRPSPSDRADAISLARLRVLLEGSDVNLGDDWFLSAARAFSELFETELVMIAEKVEGYPRRFTTHALLEDGQFAENHIFDVPESLPCCLLDGEPLLFEDGIPPEFEEACVFSKKGIRFFQGVPVEDRHGKPSGLIVIASIRPMSVKKDHETIFKIFASRAAAEMARLKSDRACKEELERTRLLQKISRAISQCIDPDQVLTIAAEQIGKVFQVSRCHIRRKEGEHAPIVAEYCDDSFLPMKDVTVSIKGRSQFNDDVLSSDSAESVPDIAFDKRTQPYESFLNEYGVKSILAARTSFGGEVNGIVALQQGNLNRSWSQEEQNLLEGIAAQIGASIAQFALSKREKKQRIAIEEARESAEAASRAKGDFLARMSHELRTPMNAILGFSQLLSSDANLTLEQKDTLGIINRSGEHLTTLINDILEMSKIEAGESEINRSVFNPAKLVNSIEEMFKIRAESKGLELRVDMPDSLAESIVSDENKLRQILTNLLGNALKFTPGGTIELKAWYFSGDGSGSKSILAFRVKDSGVGIAEEAKPNLFKPFVQSQAEESGEKGTGLGLTITKAFVELLGGQIRVESESEKGSAFSFWIPCSEVKDERTVDIREEKFISRERINRIVENQNPTVLIADDQPENRLLVVRYLKALGFTVLEAVDGQDAIDVFRESHPEVILMDIRMPRIDGLAATGAIRAMKDVPHQPLVIALTGNAFEEDKQKAYAAGCDAFLAKPFRLEDLAEILGKHLDECSVEASGGVESELSAGL